MKWKISLWVVLLVIASAGLSLVCACATPFAALATVAALTLSRRTGLWLIAATWITNQAVGYLLLDYPQSVNSFSWGAAIGVCAMLGVIAAQAAARHVKIRQPALRCALTFLSAFVMYQITLFAIAWALLGGTQNFTPVIVVQMLVTNVIALAVLLLANWVSSVTGFLPLPFHYKLAAARQ